MIDRTALPDFDSPQPHIDGKAPHIECFQIPHALERTNNASWYETELAQLGDPDKWRRAAPASCSGAPPTPVAVRDLGLSAPF
jgi:hypothetical protein